MSAIRELIEAVERGDAPPFLFVRAFADDPDAARLAEAAYMDDLPAARSFVRLKHGRIGFTVRAERTHYTAVVGATCGWSDTKPRALLVAALRALEKGETR